MRRIGELEAELRALLQAAGVGTAAEFRARGAALETRRQIELQLDAARDELNRAARTEPELAVVDDDLRRMFLDENGEPVDFDGLGNDDAIELLTMELEDLDRDRQQALAELNEVRCEIRRLLGTNPRSALVWERESARSRLQQAAVDWTAADLSVRVFEELRDWFEMHCQPAVLTDAAQYLRRLTRDQYHGLRVPLGVRTLLVTDHAGTVLSPDELSSGTREQLFLAVRLALVREWARQGKHLPLVLDDVLVNFDRHRSEAMIGLLRDVAAEGQQIVVFTCHLHLAHQFQERGVEPLWLPNRSQAWNLREAVPRAEVA
jgi:uncharacterized protein YhaN